uniref:Pancreatic progenitor cell differentiation and proliferation factor n=1 Tax=Canis lupus familiaris TaxID=9615 RepID=A0A8C0SJK8_CANLF
MTFYSTIPCSAGLWPPTTVNRHRRVSTSNDRSCARAEYPGEAIPHHTGLPKAHPSGEASFSGSPLSHGGWWKQPLSTSSPLAWNLPQASSSRITCDLALETLRKQPGGQSGKANIGPQS